MKTRYAPDKGLATRMVVTMFLIGLLYVAFIAALWAFTGLSWAAIIVIAALLLFAQYWFSDRIALYAMNAKEVSPKQAPELHGAVDRLCALADMKKPKVAIADSDVPNAFATGRSPDRAVLCATTGILRRLEPEELEGVLAHELSHVAHRDVMVMTIASFLGVLAGMITRVGLYSTMFGGMRRNNQNPQAAMVFLGIVVVSVVVYAISFLLTRALSRYRELSADRAGAILTGQPSSLASALTKVSGVMAQIPSRDLRKAEPFNAFFFAPALSGRSAVSGLLSTHPSLDKRLAKLAELSNDLGRVA
jgi:heat shock protein HtpX